jgi:hypothetical protein
VVGWLALSVLFSNALTSLVAAVASELLPGTHSFWNSWQWSAASDGVGNLLVTCASTPATPCLPAAR